jgi:hypothetical protein
MGFQLSAALRSGDDFLRAEFGEKSILTLICAVMQLWVGGSPSCYAVPHSSSER